ncbi:MAG: translocation/assembly module TamB domain-containing protein [Sphingomicrobium sp.]
MADDAAEDVIIVRRSSWPVRVARWLLVGLVAVTVVAGLFLLGINTDPGRRFLVERIAGLQFQNGMKIGIGRIDGSIYGQSTIHDLTLSDPKGVFLTVPEARLDWRPFAYLGNRIDVRRLTAPTMTLARLPAFRVSAPSNAPLLPDYDIDIDRLKVDRLILEAPVTGQRQIGSIDGAAHIADRRAQVALHGAVIGGKGQVGGDRIDLKLDAVPERNRFALGLALQGPANGLVAKLAGVKAPVALRIDGSGDWAKWDGRLAANLDNSPFARLSLTARNGRFGVRGPTRIARVVSGPTAALLGPVTTIDLQSDWANRHADLAGTIASDAFKLVTNGKVDFGQNRFDNLHLAFTLLKPSVIAPHLSGRDLRADVTLNGAFMKPTVDYAITATTIAFNDMALQGFAAHGQAQVDKDHSSIPIAATVRAITGLDSVAGGGLTNVRLDGDLAIDWPRILSDNLRIRSDRIDARLILLANVAKGLYTGAVEGRVNDYRVNSVGLFNVQSHADLKSVAGGGYDLVGRVRAQSTKLFNDGVRSFLGGNVAVSSDVAYGRDGMIRFSRLRVASPQLQVTDGRGSYAPGGSIDLRAVGVSKPYGPVGVNVVGTIANPHAIVTAARPGFGVGIAGLSADIRAVGTGYHILARGGSDYGPFTADLLVNTAAGPLAIDVTRASLAGINVHGRVIKSAAGPFTGRLDASGQGLGGIVRLAAAGRYQQLVINLRAHNTVLPAPADIAVGSAIVDARIILYDQPEVVADVQLAQARYQRTDITALRALINYRGGRGFARMLAEGTAGVPFRVAINSELTPTLWRAALQGRVSGVDIRTATPARIVPRRGGYDLLPTTLAFDKGSVRLAGSYGPGLKLQSRIDRLDMALINSFSPGLGVNGRATGSIDIDQPSSASFPRADVQLAIRDFTRTTAASVSQPVDINFIGQLQSSGSSVSAVMRTRGTVVGRLQASIDPAGAGSWSHRLSEGALRGGIRYVGPADTLFSFAGLPDQRLAGPLGVAADFTCKIARPCLQGVVRGKNLTYDNITYGTRLTQMTLNGRFTGERLEIDELTARAGNGNVSGKGNVSLAAASGYPARFDLKLDNARLANSDMLRATASGSVQLVKDANASPRLTGNVTLPATRYQIIRQGSAGVPELTGVRFKPPRGRPRTNGDAPPPTDRGFADVALDLGIDAPSQLFVSGMGLESEWRTRLKVTGTNQAPRISGNVSLVRGTLDFAGRSFTLDSGRINFNGGAASDATINLSASETIESVAVTLNVTGSATNPQISFSSTPGLPQDEIVSRILFGSSIGNLSAIQAVQLAASLNSLRGSGGGLNPLGKLRAVAGIDRLRILGPDDATGRGNALAAGKYISKNIYLEVVTDARGFTATQLEITLSRALSVLSQAGGSNATNVSVRYRKSY